MISQQIRAIRRQKNISQKELASRLYVSAQAVSKWERNEATPNPETISKMAEIFGVSADYLLGRTDQKEEPTPANGDGLSAEQEEVIKLFESAPPALRTAALAVLRSAEGQGKAPDGVSPAE